MNKLLQKLEGNSSHAAAAAHSTPADDRRDVDEPASRSGNKSSSKSASPSKAKESKEATIEDEEGEDGQLVIDSGDEGQSNDDSEGARAH